MLLLIVATNTAFAADRPKPTGKPWAMHVIDDSSRGADGVRLGDLNNDGLPDIVTGWEEGGRISVSINPGPQRVKQSWPNVTVGKVKSPEDAVFADVDGDGALDVVSSCEGKEQAMFVHWNPNNADQLTDPNAWKTDILPKSDGMTRWMFCTPAQLDGRNGIDLIAASKNPNGTIGWFESPANPRDLSQWKWHPIADAAWVMSVITHDMDDDGDIDIAFSDRKSDRSGCYWLEHPDTDALASADWKKHTIGGVGSEVMFMDMLDIDNDSDTDFLCAVRSGDLFVFEQGESSSSWKERRIRMPTGIGTGKAIRVANVVGDERNEFVVTCENSKQAVGVFAIESTDSGFIVHDISGDGHGVKYDLVQLIDLDADGDLDAITCEERDNLGIIWYENPTFR